LLPSLAKGINHTHLGGIEVKIVVTANGTDLDAPASPVFGRCPTYIFVQTETMQFEAVENPAVGAASGAGIQAAQLVVERGAQAVVTGNVGPNALDVFRSAGLPIYLFTGATVREAVDAFNAGSLQPVGSASAQAGMGMRSGGGIGMGRGRGMGMGRGRGMRRAAFGPPAPAAPPATASPSREEEITDLKETAGALRRQLAEVMERLDHLEKGE
jgi:predicted Fe-Mo cluster-binding NifX family protein